MLKVMYKDTKVEFPIVFVFGETDWMERKGVKNIENAEFIELSQTGHQINMQKPKETINILVQTLEKAKYIEYNKKPFKE